MSTKYKCDHCSKTFNKKINYDKHINRRIACYVVEYYKCENCGKEFDKIFNYEQHLKRKTPCVPKTTQKNNQSISNQSNNKKSKSDKFIPDNNSVILKIEKEKTKQEEERRKIEEQKILIEKERTKQEEEKRRIEEERNKFELERNKFELEKLKLKIELRQIESENRKEEIDLRKKNNIEIESMKDKRKEKTSTIINNNYTQNNYIEATNYINNNFDASIVVDSKGFKHKEIDHLYDYLQNPQFIKDLYKKSNDLNELLINIIKIGYNNDNHPEKRYFIYDSNSKKFFEVDPKSRKYKIVDYKYIDEYIKKATNSSYNAITQNIILNPTLGSKDHDIQLYENMYRKQGITLINTAMIGLDPNNRISKDENMFINNKIKKKTNKYDDYFSDSSDEDLYD